jgi:hypothetical protein
MEKLAEHCKPQLIPDGDEVTVPDPTTETPSALVVGTALPELLEPLELLELLELPEPPELLELVPTLLS